MTVVVRRAMGVVASVVVKLTMIIANARYDLQFLSYQRLIVAMSELTLQALAHKLDQLIRQHEQLMQENTSLRQAKQEWQEERTRLIQKNDVARERVEAMINDLKSLKEGVR